MVPVVPSRGDPCPVGGAEAVAAQTLQTVQQLQEQREGGRR
jgi:hypothetical protein